MTNGGRSSDATALLTRAISVARTGTDAERAAADAELFAAVYGELRAIAGSYFRGQAASHTLQPTALVHEAWVRLAGHASLSDPDRAHFRAVASTAMRNILVDHARAKRAAKRGGNVERVTIDTAIDPGSDGGQRGDRAADPADVVAVDDALRTLAERDPRQARIVEMRVFGGMTVDETALALGVSPRTVELDWRMARAWLARTLSDAVNSAARDAAPDA